VKAFLQTIGGVFLATLAVEYLDTITRNWSIRPWWRKLNP